MLLYTSTDDSLTFKSNPILATFLYKISSSFTLFLRVLNQMSNMSTNETRYVIIMLQVVSW